MGVPRRFQWGWLSSPEPPRYMSTGSLRLFLVCIVMSCFVMSGFVMSAICSSTLSFAFVLKWVTATSCAPASLHIECLSSAIFAQMHAVIKSGFVMSRFRCTQVHKCAFGISIGVDLGVAAALWMT